LFLRLFALSWLICLAWPCLARASCDEDPVAVTVASEQDAATRDATVLLLGGGLGEGGWIVAIDGPRTIATHRPTGQRFARTLAAESTAYDRALAALELIEAARAACTDEPAPAVAERSATVPVPAPSGAGVSFAAYAGARFDADADGPWLLRPTLGVELGALRGQTPVFLSLALEAAALGAYVREHARQGLAVRYERHDASLAVGLGVPIDAVTLLIRASGGVSIRDVTALVDGAPGGHRLDVGPIVGLGVTFRLRLVGPLGLRLMGELVVAPTVSTYRAAGIALITEQNMRLATTIALDLEAF
jgi:hypothetical protein